MAGKLLLAHDLGTSGNKATLFNTEGILLASETVSYPTYYSNLTWAEQDPLVWWNAVCNSTNAILQHYSAKEIGVVAFSGQMMGCLAVDEKGIPLTNHLIYSDQRAVKETQALVERIDPRRVFEITGHRASPSYSIEKLMWLKEHMPNIYHKTHKMLNAKDFINYKLTGRMVTEYNDASGTNALDLKKLEWSQEVIDAARVDYSKFPDLIASTDIVGEVTSEAAKATGLLKGTLVVAGSGDGGCATVGIGSVRPGITYNYIGSSSWISTTSKTILNDADMQNFTWAHPVPGYYQPCGTMQTAGSSYAWLKNELGGLETALAKEKNINPYQLLDEQVALSPVGANGVLFLPYMLGERSPRWNPDAKGAFLGLTLERKKSDMFRAVLEGITMNLGIILDVMKKQVPINEIRVLGGGAKGVQWQQILADVYDTPIVVPAYLEESTSMGAAIIGGVGVGLLETFDEADNFIQFTHRVEPIAKNVARYKELSPLFNEAYYLLEPLFSKLL